VRISVGKSGSFRLRGRIDRVDRCGEHEYEVWDYKTGSTWGYDEHKYLNGGRQLQHALYAEAAEILLHEKNDPEAVVVRAGYFFPSARGEGLRIERKRTGRKELDAVLTSLFELLRNGIFPSSYDDTYCKYCFYKTVCGGTKAVERCQARIECDIRLQPLRELKGHE
jgi:ATP-dependent helicase/nuclease subunit B